jgi:hypothetical protein
MQSVARRDDIDAIDGGLPDGGDSESDYGQIDEELGAEIMEDVEHEWAVALNKEDGNGIEEEEEKEEEKEEKERIGLEK